ncbi:chitobiase/beta-hexosaminidase C-terminal domain-containing protein [Leptospira gomenensis]|nr:chitobiase/beta-hexosaminidase C-terminal domain-containing protein [Leptospira gomenensis]
MRFLPILILILTNLISCLNQNGGSFFLPKNLPLMIIDTEGNSRIKGTFLDVDGDGVPDGIDTDSDSTIDLLVSDTNGDNVLDSIDKNGDGIQDYFLCNRWNHYSSWTGSDCGGNPLAFIDSDSDGIAEGFDTDNDYSINDPILKRIREDNVSPNVSITSANQPGTYGNAQDVTLSCRDDVGAASILYTTDGSDPSFSPLHGKYSNAPSVSFKIAEGGNGSYVLKYVCRDLSGNVSVLRSGTYVLDTTIPVINATLSSSHVSNSSGAIHSSSVTWNTNIGSKFTIRDGASDCGSGTEIRRGTASVGTPQSFPIFSNTNFSGEGQKTFSIFAYVDLNANGVCEPSLDRVGSFHFLVTRDDTAPTITPAPGAGSYGTLTNVGFSCSDSSSGCDKIVFLKSVNSDPTDPSIRALDGTIERGTQYSGTTIETEDNAHTKIKVIARDLAGNVTSVRLYEYVVDLATPQITVNSNRRYVSAEDGSISWQSDRSGDYTVRLGGGDCSTGTTLHSGTIAAGGSDTVTTVLNSSLSEGDNTIRICVTSAINVGNTTVTVTKDQTTPTSSIVSPTSVGPFPVGTGFTASCADTGGSGCDQILYTLDGSAPGFHADGSIRNGTLYAGTVTLNTAGTISLKTISKDKSGNVSSVVSQTVNIGPPPSPKGIVVASGNTKVLVSFLPVSGATSYKVYYSTSSGVSTSSASVSGTRSPIPVTGLSNGTLAYFAVTAIHNGGESPLSPIRSTSPTTSIPGTTSALHVDISGSVGQGADSGQTPSAVIDPISKKLLIATQNGSNSNKPSLFRCNLNGTSCQHFDVSSGQGANSGLNPSIGIDEIGGKVLIATTNQSNSSRPSLFRCNLDGTSCEHKDISAGSGASSGFRPKLLVDIVNSKILVVTVDFSFSNSLSLFRCDLDGTSCVRTQIFAATGTQDFNISRKSLSAELDYVNGKLVAIAGTNSSPWKHYYYNCNLDGTGCFSLDFSGGASYLERVSPYLVLDPISGKWIQVAFGANAGNGYTFQQSNLDGSSLTSTNVNASNLPTSAGEMYRLVLQNDIVNGKILAVWAGNGFQNQVGRLNPNGSIASFRTNESAGQGFNSTSDYSAVLDGFNGKLLILTWNKSSTTSANGTLSLFIL